MSAVFLSPHCDDEVLFGTFSLLREKPVVVVVYDCGPEREAETNAAMGILGCRVEHWRVQLGQRKDSLAARILGLPSCDVYAPLPEDGGQPQHNHVGEAALAVLRSDQVTQYLTYTEAGKSTHGLPVPYEPEWVASKLRALACYPSQSGHPSHAPHFIRDQTEYVAT